MSRGLFVVIEGVDGAGKATQSKLVTTSLLDLGIPAERIEIPAYEKHFFGKLLRECLDGKHGDFANLDPKIASTLYACDRFEYAAEIERLRAAGTVIVADRFTSANQIHQGGKIRDETEREDFIRWLDRMEHEVLGVPRPDAVVYLSLSLDMSKRMLASRSTTFDAVESDETYLRQSHEAGAWLASREAWTVVECEREGEMRSREDISKEIVARIQGLLTASAGRAILN